MDSLVDSLVLLQEAVARVLENQPSDKLTKCNTLSTELNIFLHFILFISTSLCTSILIFIYHRNIYVLRSEALFCCKKSIENS